VVERAPRDRRSFDILSVKKEAKLLISYCYYIIRSPDHVT